MVYHYRACCRQLLLIAKLVVSVAAPAAVHATGATGQGTSQNFLLATAPVGIIESKHTYLLKRKCRILEVPQYVSVIPT